MKRDDARVSKHNALILSKNRSLVPNEMENIIVLISFRKDFSFHAIQVFSKVSFLGFVDAPVISAAEKWTLSL